MSELRRFLNSAAIYAGTSAIASGIPFLLMPFLTRTLGPAEYGLVALFLLCINFMTHFTGIGLNGSVSVRYFDKSIDFEAFIASCVAIMCASTSFVLLVVFLASGFLKNITQLDLGWLVFAVFCAAANGLILLRLAIWQVKRKPLPFGTLRISQAGIDMTLSLFLVIVVAMGWQGRTLGAGTTFILAGSASLFLLWRGGYLSAKPEMDLVKNALRFGVPLLPHLVGGFFLLLVDRILVANIISIEAAGIYMVAVQIGLMLNLVVTSINRAFSPWLMQSLSEGSLVRKRQIVAITYVYIAILFLVAFICALLAKPALPLLVGQQFLGAAPVIPYMLFGTAFTGAYFMVTNYIFFSGRTELLSLTTICIGLFNVGLSWLLISRFGMQGAGYAFVISQAALFFTTWLVSRKVHKMPWTDPDFSVISKLVKR